VFKHLGLFPFTWAFCSLLCHRRCMLSAVDSLVKSKLENWSSKNLPFGIGIVQLSFFGFLVITAMSRFSFRLHFDTLK
jgi:hypothetical protein